MELFLNSTDIIEIESLYNTGLISGITTNPSLVAKSGKPIIQLIKEISAIVKDPISVQIVSENPEIMIKEAEKLVEISDHIVIKLPCTYSGFCVANKLNEKKIKTNLTLCFSVSQAILAYLSQATFVSIFSGRLDEMGNDGSNLIKKTKEVFQNFDTNSTKILAASISSVKQVVDAATSGADYVTTSFNVIKSMAEHRLSKEGLATFLSDWDSTNQKII